MNRPSGVIFDLGETVLCLESLDFIAGSKRLLEFTTNDTDLTAEKLQSIFDEVSREINPARDKSTIEYRVESLYRLMFETLGISLSISLARAEKEVWNAAVKYAPTEGIYEFLDMLDEKRIRTGIISNSSFSGTVMEEELAKYNLSHRFSFLISSADYGLRKPNIRIFNLAVKKMDLTPHDIWFVGDKLEYDIKGALNAGLYPVWYNPQNEPGNASYECLEVRNWHELKEIVESL